MGATSGAWDPDTYERFADLRARPFHDLVDHIVPPADDHPAIVDLGCGTGSLTAGLADRFGATVLGIDDSPHMLERAAAHTTDRVRFEAGDIATFDRPGAFDLVVSNAALHWTDDHTATLGRWVRSLRPGGQIAVQLPANFGHSSHTVAERLARDPQFAGRWANSAPPAFRGDHMLTPAAYAQLLFDLGCVDQSVDLHVYPMVLESSDDVVAWVDGTLLVPYRTALSPEDYDEFERRYRADLASEIGGPSGERRPYFFGFQRILMWGRIA